MFLLSSTYKSEGVANLDHITKISWCYDACQRSSQKGWWILIPQQDKFMFLLSSTYKSEGVVNVDSFMKISWRYGLDPLDHSPIPYQTPERWWWWWLWWWWWWWWWFSWGVEQRPGWREHVLSFFGNLSHLTETCYRCIFGRFWVLTNHNLCMSSDGYIATSWWVPQVKYGEIRLLPKRISGKHLCLMLKPTGPTGQSQPGCLGSDSTWRCTFGDGKNNWLPNMETTTWYNYTHGYV